MYYTPGVVYFGVVYKTPVVVSVGAAYVTPGVVYILIVRPETLEHMCYVLHII
jgi:hypothetical protein